MSNRWICCVWLPTLAIAGCGGASGSSSTPSSVSPTVAAAWGTAAKLSDAGAARLTLFGQMPVVPAVRLESLPEGTAFALWNRREPETVATARFSNGSWETPVEGSGAGNLDSWLAVGANGSAVVTWGERVPGSGGDFTRWTWARRYVPGTGWRPSEQIQFLVGAFTVPRTIGADIGQPPLHTGAVIFDSGLTQAIWNREFLSDSSVSGIYSTNAAANSEWTPEQLLSRGQTITVRRVSRSITVAFWGPLFGPGVPQVFRSAVGWSALGSTAASPNSKIVPAKGGLLMLRTLATAELAVQHLGFDGEFGATEILLRGTDICGTESGVLGVVHNDAAGIVLKYRSPTDAAPTFTTAVLRVQGVPDVLMCHADSAGRIWVLWSAGQTTFADRYAPGRGFEGSRSIGPASAQLPALGEDSTGNILAAWPVVTSDKKVEVWWNRHKLP